jgi:hypothetical protein
LDGSEEADKISLIHKRVLPMMISGNGQKFDSNDPYRKMTLVGALCFLALLACGITAFLMVSCSREEATLPSSYFHPTATPIPGTPTFTPTPTPILYDDFNSNTALYTQGDPWAASPIATYMYDGYGETGCSLSAALDSTLFHTSADSLQMTVSWTGADGTAAWAFYSGYAGYGAAANVDSGTPSAESFWIYPSQAISFNTFMDVSGTITTYNNTTGPNPIAPLSAPANTWTNILLPISTCPTCWNTNPTTLSFTSVQLAAGMLIFGPASVPDTLTVNIDDIYFIP